MLAKHEKEKISGAVKAIKSKEKIVAIQAPEGVKKQIQEIAREIEDAEKVETVILADPCYGACDIPFEKAKALGCQLIIHFGHADLNLMSPIPILYLERPSELDPLLVLKRAAEMEKLKQYKKVGLVAPVQHLDKFEAVRKFLEKEGKKVLIGKPSAGRAKYAGQILGCDVSSAKAIEPKVDAFIYIGTGRFHPISLLEAVKKPVLSCDLELQTIVDLTGQKNEIERKKLMRAALLKDARTVGILVSTKAGQMAYAKNVFRVKQKLEAVGKRIWVLAMDEIRPEKLLGMKFDILINAACPRIREDLVFSTPMINADEF